MNDVTTIFTVWKRSSLREQLERIVNQTISSDLVVWQNESHVDITDLREQYGFSHIHSVNHNWKFYGRFSVPTLLETKYTVILDDDTLPNPRWLEKCISLCKEKQCIVGGNGRILNPNMLYNQIIVDEPKQDHRVDFVGHAWFFETDWIRYLWEEPVYTYENAEDISFAAACEINAGISCYVPDCTNVEECGDIDKHKYGTDTHSFSLANSGNHLRVREDVIKYWLKVGWKPLFMEDA
jgi:GT2 family glycosyltransferase